MIRLHDAQADESRFEIVPRIHSDHRGTIHPGGWTGLEQKIAQDGPMYRIREVDGDDDDIADTLAELHRLTFFDTAPLPPFDHGHWWLAFRGSLPVAFAGIVPSTRAPRTGYFCRVGVLRRYCGNGLQLRLMRAVEWRARRNGWRWIVSDTTYNVVSANNFIRGGYRLYQPRCPWAWSNTLYWRKSIA